MSPMNPRLLRPRIKGDPDALRYIEAVQSADGQSLEAGVKTAIEAFVVGCKADGIWSAIKSSCILMGARTLAGALTPLVGTAPTNNGPFVSGDYDRKLGPLGNGTTKTISTGRANNADAQNDNHIYAYCSAQPDTLQLAVLLGGAWTSNSTRALIFVNASLAYFDANTAATYQRTVSNGYVSIVGGWGVARSQSDRIKVLYKTAFEDVAQNSVTPSSGMVRAYGGYTANPFAGRLSFYSVGSFLDLQLLNSRVSALSAAIGAAIL